MSYADLLPNGLTGRLTIATRGEDGPGEAEFRIRGGTETYIAHSMRPLVKGQEIVCVEVLGPRTVLVEPWGELLDSLLRL
ncbi:hypothetical protein [Leekyejoonella antrihumi]|uniref:Uncharacterized protein n=1 Tax=Leekyejoonella antrihumi TaxID=1660198 RepID=A0A563E8F1_9MICO|nr:hypothetical protein [Leekyejoonella antrihumi]TWP38589.1 hypothetical protein FGL98_02025 [Leekyejoonella antrihumi]